MKPTYVAYYRSWTIKGHLNLVFGYDISHALRAIISTKTNPNDQSQRTCESCFCFACGLANRWWWHLPFLTLTLHQCQIRSLMCAAYRAGYTGLSLQMVRLTHSPRGPRALKILAHLNAGLFGLVRLTQGPNGFGLQFCRLTRRLVLFF